MANYTAADVKRLRELTGSGMMDCKNALAETDGDFDKAVEILRIKGAKDVGKRAERTTAEGLVAAKGGVMVEINSETDFVAKNAEFQGLADSDRRRRRGRRSRPTRRAQGAARSAARPSTTPCSELSAKIGEKLELRRVVSFDGPVATYLHKRASDLPPAVGVLVAYEGEGDAAAEAARGAAMQVAALKAKYVTRDEVPADIVENERRIAEQTAREEGKPEAALPKIVEGRVNGFFKDVVLLEQSSVRTRRRPSRPSSTRPASRSRASPASRSAPTRTAPRSTGPASDSDAGPLSLPASDAKPTRTHHRAAYPAHRVSMRSRQDRRRCQVGPTKETDDRPGDRTTWLQARAAQARRRDVRRRQGRPRPRRGARRSPSRSPRSSRSGVRGGRGHRRRQLLPRRRARSSAAWIAPARITWACSAP